MTLAEVPQAGPADVNAAVAAAKRSWDQGDWRRATPSERAKVLLRLAEKIRAAAGELAALEARNVGKPIKEARGEVEMGADCFQYYAGLIPAFGGRTVPVSAPGTGLTFREPVGVCALIVPWNFPFAITTWKTAPALALGNSVVLKPASATPLSALRLAELSAEAGLPDGVLNVLTGPGGAVGDALVRHPDVRKISFTGSTEVGAGVMRLAADDIKRVSLELGGKSANLIFADADLDKAGASISGSFGNAGQDCCARSRVLVERPLYEDIVARRRAGGQALHRRPFQDG
jgi:betaine-aldehyde dehydrogenase